MQFLLGPGSGHWNKWLKVIIHKDKQGVGDSCWQQNDATHIIIEQEMLSNADAVMAKGFQYLEGHCSLGCHRAAAFLGL